MGLTGGHFTYRNDGNFDLTTPGTMVIWVAGWQGVGDGAYLWPVRIATGRGVHIFGRTPKANGGIYLHISGDKQHKVGINYDTWGDGWHMLALTWDAENIGISVDGGAPHETSLSAPLDGDVAWIVVGSFGGGAAVDELAFLNRKLTDEELKWLYEETLARSAAAAGGQ